MRVAKKTIDTLLDAVIHPRLMQDADIPEVLPVRWYLPAYAGTLIASLAVWSPLHELLHVWTNKALGGDNDPIVFNKLYGGDVYASIFSDATAQWLEPFQAAAVTSFPVGELQAAATGSAPYVLTPLGIYCVRKGKERANLPLVIAGLGLVGAHFTSIFGDAYNVGERLVRYGVESLSSMPPVQDFLEPHALPTVVLSAVLGCYVARQSYGACSAVADRALRRTAPNAHD